MRIAHCRALTLLALCSACSVDLDAGDAIITCGPKGECPTGFSCDSDLQRCVEGATNKPVEPTLVLDVVKPAGGPRFVDVVEVPFVVDDRNIPNGDTVALAFEFGIGDAPSTWFAATSADGEITGIDQRSTSGTFRWNALADAQAGTGGLTVDGAGFVELMTPVRVRARATDASGLSSKFVTSDPFAVGNTLPVADMAPFSSQIYAGLLAIELTLTDAAADNVALEIDFRTRDNQTWRRAAVDAPFIAAAPSTPDGNPYLVAWRTAAAPNADPTVPQGIGRDWASNVELRVRAVDSPEGTTTYPGPYSEIRSAGSVRNETPPQITDINVLRPSGMTGTGRFMVTYVLKDEESDLVDLRAELSIDGATWREVREYPVPMSEGFLGLSTSPSTDDGGGGVRHTLAIDPAGFATMSQARQLRLTATDGYPSSGLVTSSAVTNVGEIGAAYDYTYAYLNAGNFDADVVLGDFMGSAALDIAAITYTGVYFFTGAGDGTFAFSYSRTGASFCTAAAVGKFDGDAKDDLAVIDRSANQIRIYLSTTATPFTATTLAAGTSPEAIVTDDVNHDGRLDLVVTESGGTPGIRYYLGAAGGTFAAGVAIATSGAARGIAIADFDGDAIGDLAVASGSDIDLFYGTATAFESRQTITTGGGTAWQIAAGDFNADGHVDIVIGYPDEGVIRAYAGDGRRGFVETGGIVVGGMPNVATSMNAFDLNVDGADDLLVGALSNVYAYDGAAVFTGVSGPSLFTNSESATPLGFDVADVNGDGLPDIISANDNSDGERQIDTYVTKSAPFLGSGFGPSIGVAVLPAPQDTLIADLDADGFTDLATSHSAGASAGEIAIIGGYPTLAPTSVAHVDPALSGRATADMDGDGLVDLVTTHNAVPPYVRVNMNDGAGGFVPAYRQTLSAGAGGLVIDDFNEDGIADIVMGTGSNLTLIIGQLSGADWSGTVTASAAGVAPADIASGDFNGDGHRDIAAISGATVATRFGDGNGGFGVAVTDNLGSGNYLHLIAADINDDGRDDLIGGGVGTQPTLIVASATQGDYTPTSLAGACSLASVSSLARGDINTDGVFDIAASYLFSTCTYTATRGTVLGTGAFTGAAISTGSARIATVTLGDIDGDGTTDRVLALDTPAARVDFVRDARPYLRQNIGIVAVGEVIPTSPRWDGSNVSLLGRTTETTEANRRGALTRTKGLAQRYLVPLTAAENIVGDVYIRRVAAAQVAIGGTTGDRLVVANRLGAVDTSDASGQKRLGLDLSAASPRGVIVELPMLTGRIGAIPSAKAVRVFIGAPDWLRASEASADPLTATAGADAYLPRVLRADGYHDVVSPRVDWIEVARDTDGDLTTGSGRRFVVDTTAGVVRVLTDKLGHMQAYLDTSP